MLRGRWRRACLGNHENGTGFILAGAMDACPSRESGESDGLRGRIERELWRVAIAAEVAKDDSLKGRLQLGQHARGGGVGKVSMTGEDALLY